MADHKDQHFIPQCYLKAWCDPDTPPKHTPYVRVFPKEGSEPRKKAPENIFYEKDMYTIEETDGTRNLVLEHGLHELETNSAFFGTYDQVPNIFSVTNGPCHSGNG